MAFSTPAFSQFLDTTRIQATGLDGGVAVSTDDAEQLNNEIDKLFDDDLDMGWEGDEFNVVSTGLRFRGIDVPKNAIIDSAYLEIFSHEDEGDLAKVTIYAEASDDCATYNDVDLISDRPKTVSFVKWDIDEDWEIWAKYRSPELKTLIQEVVSRPGWQSGNALALMMFGEDQGASSEDNARDFEAFENIADPDDGGDGLNHPERIPKLYIYYSLPSATRDLQRIENISVSPNPTLDGAFRLALDAFVGEDLRVQMTDAAGRIVLSRQIAALGNPMLDLQVNVPAGVYALEVSSDKKIAAARIVKQ